jgi:hypothetical protein
MPKNKYPKDKFRAHRFQFRFSNEMAKKFGGVDITKRKLKIFNDWLFSSKNEMFK